MKELDDLNAWLDQQTAELNSRLAQLDKWAEENLSHGDLADYRAFCKRMDDYRRDHPDAIRLPEDFK